MKIFLQVFLIGMMVMSIVATSGFLGSLTEEECRACSLKINRFILILLFFSIEIDFASNDINKKIHAYFNCPRKLRPKNRRRQIYPIFNDQQEDYHRRLFV